MADMDVSINVNSDGTVSVKRDLDAIGTSADSAMAKTDKLNKSLNSVKAPTIKTVANDLSSIGTAAISNAGRISSSTAAFGKFGRDAQTAATIGRESMLSFGTVLDSVKTKLSSFGAGIGTGVQTAIGKVTALKTALMGVRAPITGVGTAAGGASLNVANLAAQFNDIGVTAAMMQNPLQIALQQGTQISQVFGNMGAGGALKLLGQSLLSVLSPMSLLTIATVAGVAALIQYVNWSKVLSVALGGIISGIQLFRANIDTLRPYLIGLAAAMVAAFGPAMLSAVGALTVAIGKGLYAAVASVFKLIMKNPFVAAFTAAVTIISIVIEKTIGWQQAIAGVIEYLGKALELVGRIAEAFGASGWLTQKGIQIQVNADQAAQDLINAGKSIGNDALDSLTKGAKGLKASLDDGSKTAADALKKSLDDGADNLSKKADTSIKGAGDSAGRSMGDAIRQAGSQITYNLSTAMSDLLVGFNAFGGDLLATVNDMRSIVRAQIQQMQAQARLLSGQAALAHQQAMSERANRNRSTSTNINTTLGSGSSSGGGVGARFANGGRFTVPGSNMSRDSTPVAFRAERGERVTVETRRQQRANDNTTPAPDVKVPVQITNVVDPSMVPAANASAPGQRSIVNAIKMNRDEIAAMLGVA